LEGFEPEVLFECTGHPSATAQMIELARFTGQVVIVGAFKEAAPVDLFRLSRKELSVTGSFAYGAEDFARALALLGDEPSLFGKLITHVLPLDRAQEAMDLMIGGKCVKVLLKSPQ
ncbi:MAG TPA: zinc-binding dehydrogenase, partial [Spirochaetia bacterium]|nr:zinc-binding dehydrogenase [Spirochaetia bacterium]